MNFYQSISDHYDEIFPLNKAQVDFVEKSFDNVDELSLLDIGCGTGNLSFEIEGKYKSDYSAGGFFSYVF